MSDRKAVEGAIDFAAIQGGAEPISRIGAAGYIQGVLYDWLNGRLDRGSSLGSRGWLINQFIESGAGASFILPLSDKGNGEVNLEPLYSAGSGTPTFTRSSIATTIGSTGLIIPVSSGVARSYYDPTTLQYMGYLAEGQRTNLLLRSQEFGTGWGSTRITVAADSIISPDGTLTADTLEANESSAAGAFLNQSVSLTASVSSAFSVFVKKGSGSFILLRVFDGTNAKGVWFNLDAGTTGSVQTTGAGFTLVSSGMQSFPNGWYRCNIVVTIAATTTVQVQTYVVNADNSFTVTIGASIYAWGAQAENNATFPSTYIPTEGSAITRNIDVDSYPTSGNIIAASGTVCLEFTPNHAPSGTIFLWGTYVDANNYTAMLHDGTNLIMRKRIAGVNYDATRALNFVSGTTYKVLGTWGAAGVTIAVSGAMGTPNANTTAAQIGSTIQIGADGNGANAPFASERNFRAFQNQFTDAQAQSVTA